MSDLAVEPRGPRDVRVRVIYKSGAEVEFDCSEFTVKRNPFGVVTEVEYIDPWPKPIHFGLDDVAAMWRVSVTPPGAPS